eukprot:sb/3478485/
MNMIIGHRPPMEQSYCEKAQTRSLSLPSLFLLSPLGSGPLLCPLYMIMVSICSPMGFYPPYNRPPMMMKTASRGATGNMGNLVKWEIGVLKRLAMLQAHE